jgi:hypothetical protein
MPPPVPLVALPDWYGQDVEAHLIQVDSALHTNGSAEILSQPERFFHLLLSTCKYQRKAIEFLQAWRATHPITDVSSVKSAFLERFQSEVRSCVAKARDALFSRQLRMAMSMSVQDYASLFKQQIVHIPEMHEHDKFRFFSKACELSLEPSIRLREQMLSLNLQKLSREKGVNKNTYTWYKCVQV